MLSDVEKHCKDKIHQITQTIFLIDCTFNLCCLAANNWLYNPGGKRFELTFCFAANDGWVDAIR